MIAFSVVVDGAARSPLPLVFGVLQVFFCIYLIVIHVVLLHFKLSQLPLLVCDVGSIICYFAISHNANQHRKPAQEETDFAPAHRGSTSTVASTTTRNSTDTANTSSAGSRRHRIQPARVHFYCTNKNNESDDITRADSPPSPARSEGSEITVSVLV